VAAVTRSKAAKGIATNIEAALDEADRRGVSHEIKGREGNCDTILASVAMIAIRSFGCEIKGREGNCDFTDLRTLAK
jgi:hypothetical protein